jgi:acyl-coenzyme A thioesterase PaaI-like protein
VSGDPGPSPVSSAEAVDPIALEQRRKAVAELGARLRQTVNASILSEVDVAELEAVTKVIADAGERLAAVQREPRQAASVDDPRGSVRMFNAAGGEANPLAPPLRVESDDHGVVVARCRLGRAYEGPFNYAHGGVSALLLDQMVGLAVSSSGHPGMTVVLSLRYRHPVPLETDLVLMARVTSHEGRKTWAKVTLATATDPDQTLVEAEGLLVGLKLDQAARLFDPGMSPWLGSDVAQPGPEAIS